jgi:sporulation protein YabP
MPENKNIPNNIIIENRKHISLSGVTDVDAFGEDSVMLYTTAGELVIRGSELHVENLSVESGELDISGNISSLVYGDPAVTSPLSFVKKLFR